MALGGCVALAFAAGCVALALAVGCGERDPAPRAGGAPEAGVAGQTSAAGLSPNARPEVTAALRAGRDAARSPADGGGRAALAWSGAPPRLRAGYAARLPFVYEAGPLGIAVGGVLYLQIPPSWGWSEPQTDDPVAPGYTEVRSDAAGIELRARAVDRGLLAVEVAGRALAAGERIEIVYGAGAEGARVDRFAERRAPIHFAVDGDGDGTRGFLPEPPTVDVAAGPAARLVATLPSTVRPGEAATLRLALLDELGNAGVEAEGEIALEVEGPLALPPSVKLPADAGGVVALEVRTLAAGVARVRARGPRGLVAESNPLRVAGDAPRVLWADLHGHSHFSDGTGTPEDYFRYARDVAGLDVAALTDHDHWGTPFLDEAPELWAQIETATARFHAPGRFVTLLGYEWTSWLHGHRHVLWFADRGRLRSSLDEATDDPAELWAALRGKPAFTFAHHSAGDPIATNWSFAPDPVLEPVTEIASVHGSSEAPDGPFTIGGAIPGNFVRDVLLRGHRLGFVGSGDSHDGHPGLVQLAAPSGGLAAILAEAVTREGVRGALAARRCYATNGPRILLEAALDGRPLGSLVPPGHATLHVRVTAPGALRQIDLVRGADVAALRRFEGAGAPRELELELPVAALRSGEVLYLRAVQHDGGAAWSSPWFVDDAAPAP